MPIGACFVMRGLDPRIHLPSQNWRRGFAGGALQVVSYGTAMWAMRLAPIAIVATLLILSGLALIRLQ